ncbi:MAG: hypothetical protein P8O70_05585 [SAR324 cluster bacterium]|nr:hypothetical protein [SAR324 cluster bacterium]
MTVLEIMTVLVVQLHNEWDKHVTFAKVGQDLCLLSVIFAENCHRTVMVSSPDRYWAPAKS